MRLNEFLDALGDLHDAHLAELVWLPSQRTIALHFTDLLSAFAGLEDHDGPQFGVITLSDVSRCFLQTGRNEDVPRVFAYTCQLDEVNSRLVSTISLWPTGKIEIEHGQAEFPEDLLPTLKTK